MFKKALNHVAGVLSALRYIEIDNDVSDFPMNRCNVCITGH